MLSLYAPILFLLVIYDLYLLNETLKDSVDKTVVSDLCALMYYLL